MRPSFLRIRFRLVLAFLLALSPAGLSESRAWKAGVAKIPITPRSSLWLAGYAARTKPSEGTAQELYAKALALEDQNRRRAVLVTTDMLGFPAVLSQKVAERAHKQYGLPRERLLLNSSHTHAGPVVDRMLAAAYDMNAEQWVAVEAYTRELEDKIVQVIGLALRDLTPARLSFGRTEATFAMNRRVKTDQGYVGGVNKEGPVDHDVPVLRVEGKRGRLRGVVFGYACHNTTLGADFYQFHGDYAGSAQEWLEARHPGAVALFVAGCGGDANPYPRGSLELARQHGETLAGAVEKALASSRNPVEGPLRCAFKEFPAAFAAPPSREELQVRLQDKNPAYRRHAQEMLGILEREGSLPVAHPYPLQAWQFGSDLTWIALAGEVVVDYALRLKMELGPEKLWIAAYSNDVFAYIPSLRVLQEGGYEGGGAMIYYLQPGPFAPSVEESIIREVHDLVKKIRGK